MLAFMDKRPYNIHCIIAYPWCVYPCPGKNGGVCKERVREWGVKHGIRADSTGSYKPVYTVWRIRETTGNNVPKTIL